jgi:hypothetical protein
MKFTKMSLVAALLVGSSAFAIENVKVSGDANVFYQTVDDSKVSNKSFFEKDTSSADIGLNLNLTADLAKNDMLSISVGAGYTVLTTLGLENNFVSNVWGGSHVATAGTAQTFGAPLGGVKVEPASWLNEAWVAISAGKSIVKLGRMELDTPLAFTEKWSIEKNTFEAAVLINQDIPDTTLVAAFVGNGNGTETFGTGSATVNAIPGGAPVPTGANVHSNVVTLGHATAPLVNGNGKFATYGSDGAYAVAVINNSFKPLTVQAWYYNVSKIATAYWLQADLACQEVPGLMAGIQYSGLDIESNQNKILGNGSAAAVKTDSDALALMVGYEMKDMFTAKLSYSTIGKKHSAGQNTATDFVGGTAQSKLYTEAWWAYGMITQANADSIHLTVEAPVNGMFDAGLYITDVSATGGTDLTEVTVTASKSFGPLDTTLAIIYDETTTAGVSDEVAYIQAYLTLNF